MSEYIGETGPELPTGNSKNCSCGHVRYEIAGTGIVLCLLCDFTKAGRSGPPVTGSRLEPRP
jgi:hypothetical protein